MDKPIHFPVKLECPQCGDDRLVAQKGGDEPEDDEMITCGSSGVQVGVWRAVRQQALESSAGGETVDQLSDRIDAGQAVLGGPETVRLSDIAGHLCRALWGHHGLGLKKSTGLGRRG